MVPSKSISPLSVRETREALDEKLVESALQWGDVRRLSLADKEHNPLLDNSRQHGDAILQLVFIGDACAQLGVYEGGQQFSKHLWVPEVVKGMRRAARIKPEIGEAPLRSNSPRTILLQQEAYDDMHARLEVVSGPGIDSWQGPAYASRVALGDVRIIPVTT